MFFIPLIRAIAIISLILMIISGKFGIGFMYLINIILCIAESIYSIGYDGLVLEVVEKQDLTKFYASITAVYQLGYLLGSILAGFIIFKFEIRGALLVDAFSFIISATCIINVRAHLKNKLEVVFKDISYYNDIKDSIKLLRNTKKLIRLILLCMPSMILINMINIIEPAFVSKILNGTATDFGTLDASLGIGAAIGAIIIGYLTHKNRERVFLWLGYLLLALSLIFFGLSTKFIDALIANFFIGVFYTITFIVYQSTIQYNTDNSIVGRISSIRRLMKNILTPIGIMFVAYLGAIVKYSYLFIILAIFLILISIVSFFLLRIKTSNIVQIPQIKDN